MAAGWEGIEVLDLAVRAELLLRENGVTTIYRLLELRPQDIYEMRGTGTRRGSKLVVRHIRERLAKYDLKLKDDDGTFAALKPPKKKEPAPDRRQVAMQPHTLLKIMIPDGYDVAQHYAQSNELHIR